MKAEVTAIIEPAPNLKLKTPPMALPKEVLALLAGADGRARPSLPDCSGRRP
jgi:hypothetical protein